MVKNTIRPNHMNVYWHDYTGGSKDLPLVEAGLTEKSILVGRIGLMLLSCGTGAWRVRSAMNSVAGQLGLTCTITVGLMSLDYTSYDGKKSNSQSLSLGNTGVNTSKLNRLERFVKNFSNEGVHMTLEEVHSRLDEIDKIQGGAAGRKKQNRINLSNTLCLLSVLTSFSYVLLRLIHSSDR